MIHDIKEDNFLPAELEYNAIPLVHRKTPKMLQFSAEFMSIESGIERILAEHSLPFLRSLRSPLHIFGEFLVGTRKMGMIADKHCS